MKHSDIEQQLSKLIEIGLSLSSEKDTPVLLEKILISAMSIANADGGTMYTIKGGKFLQMEIVQNYSLGVSLGGTSEKTANFTPLPLYLENGEPNYSNVVTCAIHDDACIDIQDRAKDKNFDFSGAQKFDESTGYNSISFLTIPMKDHKNQMIGALQLINAQDALGKIVPFNRQSALLVKTLASQAAIALTNKNLINELEALFESFIELIANAIDEKSPYTGGHCRRVPELTIMLTEAVHDYSKGPLKHFSMSEPERYELKIASWLHDCGKIVIPEYVVDKATKLETIYDRIHELDARFEIVRRDTKIAFLEQQLAASQNAEELASEVISEYEKTLAQIDADQKFVHTHNSGGEFMSADLQQNVVDIAKRYQITNYLGEITNILHDDEVKNLQISKGTLNDAERKIINKHINVTIDMLKSLKLPKHLKNIPEIAGGHHERMDGKGYPYGLTKDQMSVQTRAMGIADIFEALTACDRPYKKSKTISESLKIMKFMKEDNHIDPDIFDIFIKQKIYLTYANKFLKDYQIDDVDESALIG